MFFKSVVSISNLKTDHEQKCQTGKQNWHSTADKIHQVDSCICGYLVHVSTLCLYSFNIKKNAHKKYPVSPPSLSNHPVWLVVPSITEDTLVTAIWYLQLFITWQYNTNIKDKT